MAFEESYSNVNKSFKDVFQIQMNTKRSTSISDKLLKLFSFLEKNIRFKSDPSNAEIPKAFNSLNYF